VAGNPEILLIAIELLAHLRGFGDLHGDTSDGKRSAGQRFLPRTPLYGTPPGVVECKRFGKERSVNRR
jgi:hypothetical protein